MRRFFPVVLALTVAVLGAGTAAAQIQLVPGPQHLVAQSPKFIAVADFNADQFEDAVVSNSASNKVTVLFGGGDLTFKSILDFPIGRVLRGIDARDLNEDGKPDIAVVDFLDGRVFYVFNSGTGTFGQPASQKIGGRPIDVAIGRYDSARGNDIMAVNQTSHKVTVLTNQGGNRGFSPLGEFPVGRTPKRGIAADLDNDTFHDIVVVNTGTTAADDVSVLMNNGVGSFRTPPLNFVVGAGAKDMVAADVNNDGALDLLVLNAAASVVQNEFTVSVLVNRTETVDGRTVGTGFFDVLTPVRVSCPLTLGGINIQCALNFLTVGDFDRDTFADFAVSFFTRPRAGTSSVQTAGLIRAFAGRGDGSFDFATQVSVGFNPQGLVSGDFNGDGVVDMAVAEQGSKTVRVINALPPPKKEIGDACNTGSQCESGFCVDLTCCGTASCPADQRCDIMSQPGICAPPAPNGDPCNLREQCESGFCVDHFCCSSRSCPEGEFCNSGECAPPADNGVPCSDDVQCVSGFCTDGVCCADDRCPAGQACNIPEHEGVCTARVGPGNPCTDPKQCCTDPSDIIKCDPAFCIDGFCCEQQCSSDQSCGIPGREGSCTTRPTPTPTLTKTPTPTLTPTPAPNGSTCVSNANCISNNCVDGVCCEVPACPADQFCNISTHMGSCASKLPNGQICQRNTDCLSGNCVPGNPSTCQPPFTPTPTPTPTPRGPGAACSDTAQCRFDLVCSTDEHVCCSSSSCPQGQSCKLPGNPGFCSDLPTPTPTRLQGGDTCGTGTQCASGHCNDGTCCEADTCPEGERCDITGFEGICTLPLPEGAACSRNLDCEEGLLCIGNPLKCRVPFTPTPTLLPTAVPTATTAFDISVNRSGGCSIGDGGNSNGLWVLATLPLALWLRRRYAAPPVCARR